MFANFRSDCLPDNVIHLDSFFPRTLILFVFGRIYGRRVSKRLFFYACPKDIFRSLQKIYVHYNMWITASPSDFIFRFTNNNNTHFFSLFLSYTHAEFWKYISLVVIHLYYNIYVYYSDWTSTVLCSVVNFSIPNNINIYFYDNNNIVYTLNKLSLVVVYKRIRWLHVNNVEEGAL